jgi:4-amino-4-deoxy-L-arabinose transferase-like glycosyltransferase
MKLHDDRVRLAIYSVVIAGVAFACSHEALMTQDADALMDMTLSFLRHGTLEVPNGLDRSDTLDLVIKQTAKLGPHIYGKYPPLYVLMAAIPVRILGIRGMYLLNAIALAVLVPTYHALARRVLPKRAALLSSVALPFVVPLVAYALMELPHLLSAELVLAAILSFVLATRQSDPRAAFLGALGAGTLVGLAMGVRLQNVTIAGALVAVGFLRARRRWHVTAGQLAGQIACLAAMAAFNQARFGTPNPFTYGTTPLAANVDTEKASYFVSSPAVPLALVYPFAIALAARRVPFARNGERVAMFVALASALAWSPLRDQLWRMFRCACVFVVSSTAFVDEPPSRTFSWLNKTLLTSAPLLAVGLLGMARCLVKRSSVVLEAAAWSCLAMLTFLATRDPDPATYASTIGFFGFSPRYLVDLFPLLMLLAAWMLRRVKLGRAFVVATVVVGAPLLWLFVRHDGDDDPPRAWMLLTGSLLLAGALTFAYVLWRARPRLAWLVSLTSGACVAYACVVTTLGDSRALFQLGECDERWSRAVMAVTPNRFALVGWENAKDAVYAVRARRDAVFVDAANDDGERLRATLRALEADGRPIDFFGIAIERVAPLVEPEFRVVPVLTDPLLWRFDSH